MDFKAIDLNGAKKVPLGMPTKEFKVPDGATHVRVGAGVLSFGLSKCPDNLKICKKGKFFKIPENASFVSFIDYELRRSGHFYGEPMWIWKIPGGATVRKQ